MPDGRDRCPTILPAPHPGTRGSTFVDPRDVGIDPDTGISTNTNAHSDPTPARRSARQSRRSAKSSPSAGAGPSTEAGSSTRIGLSAGASPPGAAGPSGAARPQPALPDIPRRLHRKKARTRAEPSPGAGPSGAAEPQPAIPIIIPTPRPGRRKRRPEGPAIVERPHSVPQPGLDEPIERSPSVKARSQHRAPASGSTTPLLPAYTRGRPADPSSRWESMLVEQAQEEEKILEKTVVEFIRLDKGQPSLDPAYDGLNWGETFNAASATLEHAMRKILYYERELRLLGVSTRSPGPDRFRLHRIPSRLHLPARGDRGPCVEYRRPRSPGGDRGAGAGAGADGGIVGGGAAGAG
ncbi:hypothetical protein EPUS_03962 [Endocarpon pusillum Z07020]|uniref:Uncharacterized protein n=1 Tax=Endocarpon pusillum (strain Z07020 / HMAS-L-300199) TaxID=1263415 RepID=U1HYE3_ENDPU|nr:uncharacterized protein EPUS_03962 [Endocarpon pusillum Z07020]ERF74524.1 hypothetical protein EPUS_03962 [Endocarpon pusillum Z07020]